MIVLAGCAKRNADRELARVLEYLDRHIGTIRSVGALPEATDADTKIAEWLAQRFERMRADLERLEHRRTP